MRKLILILAVLAQPALCQDQKDKGHKSFDELYPPMPGVEYYCMDAHGKRHELGDTICVSAQCTTWIARCETVLNNPTWRKLSDGCPAVALATGPSPAS